MKIIHYENQNNFTNENSNIQYSLNNKQQFKGKTLVKPFNAFANFEEGLSREKLKKIEMRKDAILLLNMKQKYDYIYQQNKEAYKNLKTNTEKEKIYPHYAIDNSTNLFSLNSKKLGKIYNVYEMEFKELEIFDLDFVANLPNLAKVDIRFSKVNFSREINFINFINFYPSLLYLDLQCNNLNNDIFNYLKNIATLKTLNLMGNNITGDIADLSNLQNLSELNLSYNKIESYFINLAQENVQDNLKNENFNLHNNNKNNNSSSNFNIGGNLALDSKFIEDIKQIDNKLSMMSDYNNDKIKEENTEQSKIENIEENKEENLGKTKETFEEWQKFLKTNLQEFYHNISQLRSLHSLNLSHNKIHFFDIDPFLIQQTEGFRNLRRFDLSSNLLEEEISILLVMNIPKLEWLNINRNPIKNNLKAYENIEFEFFKNRNILLYDENNKIGTYTNEKLKKKINRKNLKKIENFNSDKNYKIKKFKLDSHSKFDKEVKSKISEITTHRRKLEADMENDTSEIVDIINNEDGYNINNNYNDEEYNENDIYDEDQSELNKYNANSATLKLEEILSKNKKQEDVFITKEFVGNNIGSVNKLPQKKTSVNSYDEFLKLANKCFGKGKHYKQNIQLPNAYQRLRFLISNSPLDLRGSNENANYLKPTVSRTMHLGKYIPNQENFQKDIKQISQVNKLSNSISLSIECKNKN